MRPIILKYNVIWLVLSLIVPCFSAAEKIDADLILQKTDEVRVPQRDYSVTARLTSIKPGKEEQVVVYQVLMKGREKTIIKTLKPDIDRGTSMLMLRYDLWVFMETISKPLRISLQQRLFGEAANGDIARANFSGDYIPKLEGIEKIRGKEFYVLNLTARNEKVTYHKVKLWVMKGTYYPLKGMFYAISGKLLKSCYYTNYKDILKKKRPTRLVLDNPIVKGQKTIIDYYDMKLEDFSDKIFTKNYLKKLKY